MTITKEVLKKAKEGMKAIIRTGRTCYIQMRYDSRYIDYIVEKGNPYYCGSRADSYVFWDDNVYGFTFSSDIFEKEEPEGEK